MRRICWVLAAWSLGCTGAISGEGGNPSMGSAPATGGSGGSAAGAGGTTDPIVLPGGVKLEGKPAYYRVVRLTHQQWENAARELLQLPQAPGLSSGLSPDPPDGKFANNERALYLTNSLWTDYQRAAEKLGEQVSSDPAALARLGSATDSAGFIRKLGHAAYRRPLSAEEEQRYAALYASGPMYYESGNAFADGARVVIEALLQSPHFLNRVELAAKGQRLSGGELATKLSLLLRDAPPDATLLSSAEQNGLDDAKLSSVAGELLAGSSARMLVERFHTELLGLGRYGSIAKDTTSFPDYEETLNANLL